MASLLQKRRRQGPPGSEAHSIGDGAHAFDVMLPQFAAMRAGELVVVAISGAGVEQALRVPKPDEQAAEALIAAPMTRILDKLDMLMAAQRQLQVNQRSLQRTAPVIDGIGQTLCSRSRRCEQFD